MEIPFTITSKRNLRFAPDKLDQMSVDVKPIDGNESGSAHDGKV